MYDRYPFQELEYIERLYLQFPALPIHRPSFSCRTYCVTCFPPYLCFKVEEMILVRACPSKMDEMRQLSYPMSITIPCNTIEECKRRRMRKDIQCREQHWLSFLVTGKQVENCTYLPNFSPLEYKAINEEGCSWQRCSWISLKIQSKSLRYGCVEELGASWRAVDDDSKEDKERTAEYSVDHRDRRRERKNNRKRKKYRPSRTM